MKSLTCLFVLQIAEVACIRHNLACQNERAKYKDSQRIKLLRRNLRGKWVKMIARQDL